MEENQLACVGDKIEMERVWGMKDCNEPVVERE